MNYKGMSRSHLFLIELIVVILFFAFASVITVQVFSNAFQLDDDTTTLNGALTAVQTAAEMDKTIAFNDIDPSGKTLYFNKDWNVTNPADAVYTIKSEAELVKQQSGTMAVYNYTASSGDNVIYRLQAKKYYSGKTAADGSANEVN